MMAYSFSNDNDINVVSGGCLRVNYIVLGMIENNTYLVDDGCGGVIVVDPSCKPSTILDAVGSRPISALFITHCHFDHVGALNDLREHSKAPVYASAIDAEVIEHPIPEAHATNFDPCPVDRKLQDGDVITVGNTTWKALLTPGHTKGGLCYFISPENGTDAKGAPMLLSGDTLFYASIGRTDFEGGSLSDMRHSLRTLEKLPANTIVMPGHGRMTTIGAERARVFDAYR